MKEYIIKCPDCKSTFDMTKSMNKWKEELVLASGILDKIKNVFELYSHPEENGNCKAQSPEKVETDKAQTTSGSDTNHKQIKDSVDEDY